MTAMSDSQPVNDGQSDGGGEFPAPPQKNNTIERKLYNLPPPLHLMTIHPQVSHRSGRRGRKNKKKWMDVGENRRKQQKRFRITSDSDVLQA